MKKEDVQKNMESALIDQLKGSGLSPQEGVSAMMSAVCGILDSVAIATRQINRKAFVKMILKQTLSQI